MPHQAVLHPPAVVDLPLRPALRLPTTPAFMQPRVPAGAPVAGPPPVPVLQGPSALVQAPVSAMIVQKKVARAKAVKVEDMPEVQKGLVSPGDMATRLEIMAQHRKPRTRLPEFPSATAKEKFKAEAEVAELTSGARGAEPARLRCRRCN